MSRRCSICGKKSMVAVVRKKLRGKYNPTSKKRKYPNLQWVFLKNGKRVKACTKCIKTMNKAAKIKTKKEPEKETKKKAGIKSKTEKNNSGCGLEA